MRISVAERVPRYKPLREVSHSERSEESRGYWLRIECQDYLDSSSGAPSFAHPWRKVWDEKA